MDFEAALREIADAVAAGEGARARDGKLRLARQVLARNCLVALEINMPAERSLPDVIRLATQAAVRSAQRTCAVLLVHALAVPGLVPAASAETVCALMESTLHNVLRRMDYPFSGSLEAKMRVLERLHVKIGELMQPLEPTFPNWQGLYAG